MRRLVLAVSAILACGVLSVSAHALPGGDLKDMSDEQIAALEVRAEHAQPRDQAFLFAQLIATTTFRLDHEMARGDVEKASTHLNRVQEYSRRMHETMGQDARKMRDAEILIRQTTEHLHAMVHQASLENRDVLHTVETRLSDLQSELMLKVFAH